MKSMKFFYSVLILNFTFFFSGKPAQAEPAGDPLMVQIQPASQFVTVKGDREKFEEDHWTSRNSSGGIESMSISKQLNKQDSLEFEGRAIAGNNNYAADLTLAREGLGSLEIAFKEFRKYYDGTGGYYSLFNRSNLYPAELDNDLHLDVGNFKIEGILAKENSPEYTLGYEREFRSGSKSTLHWGTVTGSTVITPKIYPAYLTTDETADTVKFGVKHETRDSEASAEQRWEHVESETRKYYSRTLNLLTSVTGAPSADDENVASDLYTTMLRYSKDVNKKLSFSCGLLYNRYKGGSLDNANVNAMDNFASIEQDSVSLFPNLSYAFSNDLNLGFGAKAEFFKKIGAAMNNKIVGTASTVDMKTEVSQQAYTQDLRLKYSGIKDSSLYADLEFKEVFIDTLDISDSYLTATTADIFRRKTNAAANTSNFTLGYKWYMNPKVNLTVEDKFKSESTYNDNKVVTGESANNYRGFINSLLITSNTPLVKLNYKPYRWLHYNLGYIYDSSTYGVETRNSGETLYDKYDSHTGSIEATVALHDYLYFTLFYQKKYSVNKTRASDITTLFTQPAYETNADVFSFSCSYAPTAKTTLTANYSMSRVDNFENFVTISLPYGTSNLSQDMSLGVEHKLNKDTSLQFKYTLAQYDEDSNDGIDNYEANLLYAALNMKF